MRQPLRLIPLLLLLTLLAFVACSSEGDSSAPLDGDTLDGDTLDGDAFDADVSDGDLPDGDTLDGDRDAEPEREEPATFSVALLADTHLIDEFYEGPEGSPLDTETIFETADNLTHMRTYLNGIDEAMNIKAGFIAGDVFHNYPSTEEAFYDANHTRLDIAAEMLAGFDFPVYPGWGNHDYDIGSIPRDTSNRLLKKKFGVDPYYYVDIRGFRFIHVNNFMGDTMDPEHADYNDSVGSLGLAQLDWLEDLLSDGLPGIIILHFPLATMDDDEGDGRSLAATIEAHQDTLLLVLSGHVHMWMDFGQPSGVQHWTLSSTRYEPDAVMLIECDTESGACAIKNRDCIHVIDSETDIYDPETGACTPGAD